MAPALVISMAGLALLAGAAYLAYRFQWRAIAAIAPLCCGLMFFSVAGQSTASLVTPLVLGTAGGLTFRKGAGLKTYLVATTLVLAATMTGNYYYMLIEKKTDMLEISRSEMASVMEQNEAPADLRESILGDFDRHRETIKGVIPFIFFLNALAMSSLAYLGMKVFFLRYTSGPRSAGLEFFRLNDFTITALISGLAVFLLVDSSRYWHVYSVGLNLLLFSAVFYCIQAVGVIKFMIIKKGLPLFLLPAGFLVLAILGIQALVFTLILLTGFGTLDFWADFRKLGGNSNIRSEQQ
ncbi:MAG TPA: DUF2232 domain-containing protein [Spirochaetota bacterium]|nr:DUF2232 domain-containing protein [Spirochaetota bacterium]HRZ28243.1 DUF2232 domain-containing protein [Spirochaetota bacterium]